MDLREDSPEIRRFDAVNLDGLDQAQLHDRVESKVILPEVELPTALADLAGSYRVLEHDGHRIQDYRNTYFDTPCLRNFHDHHNQRAARIKVRYRTYLNSDITYFELKRNVHGRTIKERQRSNVATDCIHQADGAFLYSRTGTSPAQFGPSLTVTYQRILLVKYDFSERVTIDIGLEFRTSDDIIAMPGLAIVEFKQPRLDRRSPAITAMSRRPQKFSKYCMGLASCDPSLRQNRFKKVFRSLTAVDVAPTRLVPDLAILETAP